MRIDLNCDMGESYGVYTLGHDEQVLPFVTSINVACGFHAADPGHMVRTVRLAAKYGVAVGAHPSLPDRVGFGRRVMAASPEEIRADTIYQIGALMAICRSEGTTLQHVKPHGALYNMAAADIRIATAIASAMRSVDEGLFLVCLSRSAMVEAAQDAGIPYVEEAFADRAYTRQGTLVPRNEPGALIRDAVAATERILAMVRYGCILSVDGEEVPMSAQTICVHGDTPEAVEMVRQIRKSLEEASVRVEAFSRSRGGARA